jgi:hypothetical protein
VAVKYHTLIMAIYGGKQGALMPKAKKVHTLHRCAKSGEEKLPNIHFNAHHFSD